MKNRILPVLLLVGYAALLIKLMVLKDLPLIRIGPLMLNFGGTHEGPPNLVPFRTILPYMLGHKGLLIAGINILGNILLLVPIGFLFPLVFGNMTWKRSLVLAVAAGSVIECMQVLLHVGIFDIDDIILNALGVLIGHGAWVLSKRLMRSVHASKVMIATFTVMAVAVAFFIFQVYRTGRLPVSFGEEGAQELLRPLDQGKAGTPNGRDLCGGTGGTGQIVGMSGQTITIKRKDGVEEAIRIDSRTTVKTPAGDASGSDLRIGDRVTVVVGLRKDDPMAASLVLVCSSPVQEPVGK